MILSSLLASGPIQHPRLPRTLQVSLDLLDHEAQVSERLELQPKLALVPS